MLFWLLTAGVAMADGFGGVGLKFVGEADSIGSELLIAVDVLPLTASLGGADAKLLASQLSWGIAPQEGRLDQLVISGLQAEQVFGVDTVASFWLGSIRYEQDFRMFELGLLGGQVALPVAVDRLHVSVGGDLRMRDLGEAFGEDWSMFLGIPLAVRWKQPLRADYWSVSGGLRLRPSVGVLGNTPVIFDGLLDLGIRYAAVSEEAFRLEFLLENVLRYDTFTDVKNSVEERLNLGVSARF